VSEHLVRLAQAGDLDALLARMDDVPEEDRDEAAYKWLNVAVDFGHAEADERIADLMEGSSLRFDDDQFLTGNAHWELGLAYLTAGDSLPRDLGKAAIHLEAARDCGYPMSVEAGDEMIFDARKQLDQEAREVFDSIYVPVA
jgi:TPR repeat protein